MSADQKVLEETTGETIANGVGEVVVDHDSEKKKGEDLLEKKKDFLFAFPYGTFLE